MINKLKKTNDLGGIIAHSLLSLILPVVIFFLINSYSLYIAAIGAVIVSKWRVFMVSPRYWIDNIKANGVDFIFGISIVSVMYLVGYQGVVSISNKSTDSVYMWRILVCVFYAVWLIIIKHLSGKFGVMIQAFFALTTGLTACFWMLAVFPQYVVAIILILIITSCSYHIRLSYQDAFEGQYLSLMWLLASSFLSVFIFTWVASYNLLNGLVLTTSGSIIAGLFIAFELAYFFMKRSNPRGAVISLSVTTLVSILVFGAIAYNVIA